jgi:hypothetical protein
MMKVVLKLGTAKERRRVKVSHTDKFFSLFPSSSESNCDP